MIKLKYANKNYLYVGEKYVDIKVNAGFQMLEIYFNGKFRMGNMLSDKYIVKKGRNAIIIIKKTFDKETPTRLFKYLGQPMINHCKMYDESGNTSIVEVDNYAIQFWSFLGRTFIQGEDTDRRQVWDSLTRYYQDLEFNGNNKRRRYIYTFTEHDVENNTYTSKKEIRIRKGV